MPISPLTLSGLDDGTPANETDTTVPLNQLYNAINDMLAGNQAWEQLNFGVSAKTIASDAITITNSYTVVDTEGAAASDNLATINGGNDGDFLILTAASASRVITLQNGIGNVVLSSGNVNLSATKGIFLFRVGATWSDIAPATAASPRIWQARLTLSTGVAVPTTDITAATTLYRTQYFGNKITLYVNGNWLEYTLTSDLSIILASLTASKLYDVFCYSNSGTPTLELLAWTSGTARATALGSQDGELIKSGDATRRYVGTIRITTVTGQCEDSLQRRLVYNHRNRIRRRLYFADATSHAYTTAACRLWNATAANKLEMVVGVAEEVVAIETTAIWTNSGVLSGGGGTLNGSVAPNFGTDATSVDAIATSTWRNAQKTYAPPVGDTSISAVEFGGAGATFTNIILSGSHAC